jgi:hypothetical protein
MDGVIRDVQHLKLNLFIRLSNQQAWHLIRYHYIEYFNDFWDVLPLQIQIRNLMSYQILIIIQQKYILVLLEQFLRLLEQQLLLYLVKLIILG